MIPKYIQKYNIGCGDISDKATSRKQYVFYMLSRCQSMFTYSGQPETIPQRMLELYLQMNGNCCIAKHNGELYAFVGGLGGEPDVYYNPTIYTIANPGLNYSANLKIDEDCVVIYNDSMWQGLLPMFERYSELLSENDITMRIADINIRNTYLLSAPDDRTKAAGEKYLSDIEKGILGVIGENAFLDGIRAQPLSNGSNTNISQLIELHQYLKASWFNEIGLQSNYNMKRESLNSSETLMDNDALIPLIDDMLKNRKEGLDKVNKMFGTNISVELNSSWKARQEETDNIKDYNESGQPENEKRE